MSNQPLDFEIDSALKAELLESLRPQVIRLIGSEDESLDQMIEFVLALLANNPTPSSLASELQELTILNSDELAKLVEEIFEITRKTQQVMKVPIKPTPAPTVASNKTVTASTATPTSPPTAASSSTSTSSSSSVIGRKRLDRSANHNPEVSTLAQPSKIIKLSSSHASVAGQPPSKAATSGAEPLEPVVDAAGQPAAKKVVKLGSSSAGADRKARFASTNATSASFSSMDIDASTSQPSVPVKAAVPTANAPSGHSIRKLRDPNEKKWTYEDEEKAKKEKAEQFRKQREEAERSAAIAAEAAAAKKRVRCSFWPQCANGDLCEYHHPTAICTKFPHCNFGDSCLFIHPAIPCRYGLGCTNANCSFAHPPGRRSIPNHKAAPGGAPNSNPTLCKFGVNCARMDCVFTHPPGRALPLGGKVTPATQIVCRFDPKCITFPKCPFVHPSKGQKLQAEEGSEGKPAPESDTAATVPTAPLD